MLEIFKCLYFLLPLFFSCRPYQEVLIEDINQKIRSLLHHIGFVQHGQSFDYFFYVKIMGTLFFMNTRKTKGVWQVSFDVSRFAQRYSFLRDLPPRQVRCFNSNSEFFEGLHPLIYAKRSRHNYSIFQPPLRMEKVGRRIRKNCKSREKK